MKRDAYASRFLFACFSLIQPFIKPKIFLLSSHTVNGFLHILQFSILILDYFPFRNLPGSDCRRGMIPFPSSALLTIISEPRLTETGNIPVIRLQLNLTVFSLNLIFRNCKHVMVFSLRLRAVPVVHPPDA